MKKIGIILLVLQGVALLGGVASGSIASTFSVNGAADIFRLLGYFLPAIIGVILINKAGKKK